MCGDYCLHEEILLALTEAVAVLQANTLSNQITLMEEWKGRGEGPWKDMERLMENDDAGTLTIPGPAWQYTAMWQTQRELESSGGGYRRRGGAVSETRQHSMTQRTSEHCQSKENTRWCYRNSGIARNRIYFCV